MTQTAAHPKTAKSRFKILLTRLMVISMTIGFTIGMAQALLDPIPWSNDHRFFFLGLWIFTAAVGAAIMKSLFRNAWRRERD
jgi:hypothetical protein